MFQQHVPSTHVFAAVEPGKRHRASAADSGMPSKQSKNRTPTGSHLYMLHEALNAVSLGAAGSWSPGQVRHLESLQNELRLAIRDEGLREFKDDSSDDDEEVRPLISDRIGAMRGLLGQLLSESPELAGQLESLRLKLDKKLPSDLGEDVRGSSDFHGPSAPETKTSDVAGNRTNKQQVRFVGNTFLVTLLKHKGKHNKLTKLLTKKGPQELVLAGIGAATAEFWMPGATHKNTAITILRDNITMEVATGTHNPEMLLPGMLMEMRWEGDPTWYLVSYSLANGGLYSVSVVGPERMTVHSTPIGDSNANLRPGDSRDIVVHLRGDNEDTPGTRSSNVTIERYTPMETTLSGQFPEDASTVYIFGKCGVILVSDGSLYEFNREFDEWRYPKYGVFVEEDRVRLMTDDGPRIAVVTEVRGDHSYICEWTDRRKEEFKNFEVDVYYEQAVKVVEDRQVSEASEEDESEEEEDNYFEKDEIVYYQGHSYKVESVQETANGYEYTIYNRQLDKRTIRTEQELRNDWEPEFSGGDDVVYNNEAATVVGVDYQTRHYEIALDSAPDDAPALKVSEGAVSRLYALGYDSGRVVFFNFGYYTISSARLTYILSSESGEEVSGITEDELSKWVLVLDPKKKTNDIWCIVRKMDKKVKGKYVPHYLVRNASGKQKWIRAVSKNVKEQEDADSFFEDAMRSDDELDEVLVFVPGQPVTIIGAGSNDEQATVVRRIPGAELDDEQYEVTVDGKLRIVPVGQLAKIESEKVEKIAEEIGDTVTDVYGATWTIVRFEDGQAIWEEFEEGSSSSSDSEDPMESEDDEEESDFNTDEYVTLDGFTEVYEVTEAKNNVYTIVSAWDEHNSMQGVSVDRLQKHENEFAKGDEVLFSGVAAKIAEARKDGVYVLQSGEEVTEDQLEEYTSALKKGTFVRRVGSGVVYKVKSFKKGQYTLINLSDKSVSGAVPEDVLEHEAPLFEKNDYVQLDGEPYPRKVKSFKKKDWSYTLEGIDGKFREMQLKEPTDPEFETGDNVVVIATGQQAVIKKVIRENGSYLLKSGAEVKEEDLEAAPDED